MRVRKNYQSAPTDKTVALRCGTNCTWQVDTELSVVNGDIPRHREPQFEARLESQSEVMDATC